ncbi:MAG: hypothetical protein M0R32_09785 [Candidatus Cloacimonetes bacterium]|jgi:hypothetical protein|nr:hypothetical protein [Candidatus Cloacimonadota bacterium]
MKSIYQLFDRQFSLKKEKNWDVLSIAVDWHDTLMPSTYTKENQIGESQYYPYCLEALQRLSARNDIHLVLFTSSYPKHYQYLLDDLEENGIHIHSVNANPDEKDTKTGDFSKKFYFNILLDDRAGFQPETDWKEICGIINLFPQ